MMTFLTVSATQERMTSSASSNVTKYDAFRQDASDSSGQLVPPPSVSGLFGHPAQRNGSSRHQMQSSQFSLGLSFMIGQTK
jgi:hypothetical protein